MGRNVRVKNLSSQDVRLSAILESMSKGEYAIPVFQRAYVWKPQQCRALADSIVKGYPINSLLLMPTGGTLDIAAHALKANGSALDGGGKFYVMDGQQRLTSMHSIFVSDDETNYYYDLLALLELHYPEDGFEELVRRKFGKPRADTDCVCVQLKSDDKVRNRSRFVRCKVVVGERYNNHLVNFVEELKDAGVDDARASDYLDTLNGILSDVRFYAVPTVTIPADSSLEVVCRIFERLNTAGTKLNIMDLMNAKTHGSRRGFDGGITAYVSSRILEWNPYRSSDAVKARIDTCLKFDPKSGCFTSLDVLLKAVYIASQINNGSTRPKLSAAILLRQPPASWFSHWDRHEADMFAVLQWTIDTNLIAVAQSSLLEVLVGVMAGLPEAFKIAEYRTSVLRYAMSLLIDESNISLQECRRAMDFIEIGLEVSRKGFNHRQIKSRPADDFVMTEEQLAAAKPQRKPFAAIMTIMYHLHHQEKFRVDLLGNTVDTDRFDEHHLVPKASGSKHPLANTIANIVLLDPHPNRHVIRDADIEAMTAKTEKVLGSVEARRGAFASNLVPDGVLDDGDFLEARGTAIIRYVNDFLQPRQPAGLLKDQ